VAYFVGLDLGQSQDYTALAVVQTVPVWIAEKRVHENHIHLRHLERFPLKTPYTEVADRVRALLTGPPFSEDEVDPIRRRIAKPRVELIVDKTGVGVAVTDLLKERRLNFTSVTITGMGQKVGSTGRREYSVPKQDLVSALEVPFHKGTLKVAEGLALWPTLRSELLTFRRKQNTRTTHISYEHWRESDHDDLVLAAALACWKATYKSKGTRALQVIDIHGRRRNVGPGSILY
jgi:hypothetical protein